MQSDFINTDFPSAPGGDFLPGLDPDPAGLDYEASAPPADAPRYTAAAFLSREPYKADILIKLLGRGLGQLEAARLVGVSVHTVRAVLAALPENIAIERERQRRKLRGASALVLEGLLEDLSNPAVLASTSPRDKAVILGILEDKVAGPAPASVTINLGAPGHRDLVEYLQRVGPAGDSTGGAGEIGFGAGARGVKGAPAVVDVEAVGSDSTGGADPGEVVEMVGTDSESVDSIAQGVEREGFTNE